MMSIRERLKELNCVVIIPTYNNDKTLSNVIKSVQEYASATIVVDDGSTDTTKEILAKESDIILISYIQNRGKGHALKCGIERAIEMGFRYAITIDSDGQHFASDIPLFVEKIIEAPDSLIVGARDLKKENMPEKNSFANKFSNFWFYAETGKKLTDTQSGYRLYPLEKIKGIKFITSGYELELEVIVRAVWRGISVINIPIEVYYPPKGERVSHFRPFKDFFRISLLNTVLVLIALLYYFPITFFKALTFKNIATFFNDNLIHSKESIHRKAAVVGLGIFCGIIPIWGYQMIFAGFAAHFLRLNKLMAITFANISIPPMIPIILYGSLLTGSIILDRAVLIDMNNITFEAVKGSLTQYILGSFVLAITAGVVASLLTYLTIYISRLISKI